MAAASRKPETSKELLDPEQPKGSIWRTVLIVAVLLAVVAAVVTKIRKNKREQDADAALQTAALDQPIPIQIAAVERPDDADLYDRPGNRDRLQHRDREDPRGRAVDAGECPRGPRPCARGKTSSRSIRSPIRPRSLRPRAS